METKIKTLLVLFSALVLSSTKTLAQDGLPKQKQVWAAEIDPATFAFGGYGVHLRYSPKRCEHLLVGVGAYAMDMPAALVDINASNKAMGWKVRIKQGIGFFAEHHFRQINNGWLVGAQLGWQQYKLNIENEAGTSTYSNSLVMLYGGYSWKIKQTGLYLKPWMGLGWVNQLGGTTEVGSKKYLVAPVTMFATLHVGYMF